MDLTEELKKLRPTLSEGSLKTYTSILRSLHSKIFGGSIEKKDYDDSKKILDFLKDVPANKRKTILSALVVISNNNDYRKEMLGDIKDYSDDMKTHDKSDSQKENWISKDELHQIYNSLKNESNLLYKKEKKTMTDLQNIQDFIIICLLGGIFIAPRRSLDYCCFKINKPIDVDKDNYMLKNEFVFNTYKTAKFYNQQRVDIPKELASILKKWIKVNPTQFLLFDTNENEMSNVKLNQRLNKILGRKASVNILRHCYLTDKYGDELARKSQMDKTAEEMGTSSGQITGTYIKND